MPARVRAAASIIFFTFLFVIPATPGLAQEKFLTPGPVELDREGERWAERTLRRMSLEEKIGQMLMIWMRAEFLNAEDPEFLRLQRDLEKYHIGAFGMTVRYDGIILARNQPYEAAMLANRLQRLSKLPLIIAADFERGVSMRLNGTTMLPHSMAFGAAGNLEYAEAFGRITAQEARAVGVHWNFFPVADVNSNPANPIINTRSFGEDPELVGELAAAYIRGARAHGMLTTGKHFPGHGDTDTDSHIAMARVGGDRARLEAVELPPFRRSIEAGVDSMMIAHVTVPAVDPRPNVVASISEPVITGLLRKEMGFEGLIVTDAMDMAGLTLLFPQERREAAGRAAVAAVLAGNDMVLIPSDLDGAYHGLLNAVRGGEIAEERIDQSVRRLLRAKASVGLHRARLVDVNTLERLIAHPESVRLGQEVANAALTLVRDNGQALPVRPTPPPPPTPGPQPYVRVWEPSKRVVAVMFVDSVRGEPGRAFERTLRARVPDVTIYWVDPRTATPLTAEVLSAAREAETVIAAMYAVPVAGRLGQLTLLEPQSVLMRALLAQSSAKTVVVAMGSPYVGSEFPEIQNYLCTFSNVPISEVAAVRALFGEIPIRGRLPVSVPNLAERGSGIQREAGTRAAGRE